VYRSCSKNINNYLEEDTKTLEQAIDVIWIVNITLSFLTPYEHDIGFSDRFVDIAIKYLIPGFVFDVLSTLTLVTNYSILWLYYLKILRAFYFPRAMDILHRVIDPIVTRCNMSK
jgi:hypothetical protein